MKNKGYKKLVFAVILLATIFATQIIINVEWPDPKGFNVTTIQNV